MTTETNEINKKFIQKEYRDKLKEYKNKYDRALKISFIPDDLDKNTLISVIDKALETGYSFLLSYCSIKAKLVTIIHIDDLNFTQVTDRDTSNVVSILRILNCGDIPAVTVDEETKEILGGYEVIALFRALNETSVPVTYNVTPFKSKNRDSVRRRALYNKYKGICYICGRKTLLTYPNISLKATIDHKIPRAKGGADTADNRQLCCLACNRLKTDFSYSPALVQVIKQELKDRKLL